MLPPETRNLLRDLREELKALDMAIATFERLAKIREQSDDGVYVKYKRPGQTPGKRGRKPGAPGGGDNPG